MKLLFVTQKLDSQDSILGIYYNWVLELAKHFKKITVVCLFEGKHELPENVTVYSLGKEKGKKTKFQYAFTFLKLSWKLRNSYDAAFVHMNQEYILISGLLWKFLGKKVYMWRNHYAGSLLTDVAAVFCTKIFCTSRYSYTAKYKKTVYMPVGVDTNRFSDISEQSDAEHKMNSILFFSRISPSKKAEVLIEALKILNKKGIEFSGSFYGDALPVDHKYYLSLKKDVQENGLADKVIFYPGVPNTEAPKIFRAHEIFVNCSPSGMFDKTLFEAAACGCLVLASSEDFARIVPDVLQVKQGMAESLERILTLPKEKKEELRMDLQEVAISQNLPKLIYRLVTEIEG